MQAWSPPLPTNEVCEGYVFTPVCQSFCSQGEYLGRYPPGRYNPHVGTPPMTKYTPWAGTPPGPGTPPGTRYTPLRPGTPCQAGTPPQQVKSQAGTPDQVHPPRTRYTHPGPGTPPEQCMVGDMGKRVVPILLECILVIHFFF